MFHVIWVPYTLATDWGGCYKFDEIFLGSYDKLLPDDLQERALHQEMPQNCCYNLCKKQERSSTFLNDCDNATNFKLRDKFEVTSSKGTE